MKLSRRIITTAVAVMALSLPSVIAIAQPAAATVTPGCSTSINRLQNSATAQCNTGSDFRVTASCLPSGWLGLPITIYGPWVKTGSTSMVFGNAQVVRCGIIGASFQVRPPAPLFQGSVRSTT